MLLGSDIRTDELSRCLFDESNDAFFIVDPVSLKILNANPASLRLCEAAYRDLQGANLLDLISGDSTESVSELMQCCRKTTFFHSRDGFVLKCKSGNKDISASVSRLHGESQTWTLLIVRDVSSTKLLERSLKESNRRYENALKELRESRQTIVRQEQLRAVGHLANSMAHDLNNLLSPIVTYASLLESEPDLNDSAREQIGTILTSALDAAESIRRLRRFSAKSDTRRTVVDLSKLIAELPGLTSPRWKSQQRLLGGDIKFQIEVDHGLPFVFANESEIRQVLMNLVLNSVDSLGDGGNITLKAITQPASVEVVIVDSGQGMTAEQLGRCFDSYYSTKPDGAGLGLSLCRGIVEEHGGRISIESDCQTGTRVTFSLPSVTETNITLEAETADIDLSKIALLCVEDDDAVRRSLVALLRTMGANVDVASSGSTGVQMMEEHRYDAVISDLGLRDILGWDVARAANERLPNASVCILSGWSPEEIARQLPADIRLAEVLAKPVNLIDLRRFLTDVAQRIASSGNG